MSELIPETGAAVLTIERAAKALGMGRSTAYELIRRGEFPVRVISIGRRRMVPVALLEQFLLGDEAHDRLAAERQRLAELDVMAAEIDRLRADVTTRISHLEDPRAAEPLGGVA